MSGLLPDDRRDEFGDDALAQWLRENRRLLREADETHALAPPEQLDRIVLDLARREIRWQRPESYFHGLRWAAPVAIAATLVLSFVLVLQMNRFNTDAGDAGHESERREPSAAIAPPAAPAPATESPRPAARAERAVVDAPERRPVREQQGAMQELVPETAPPVASAVASSAAEGATAAAGTLIAKGRVASRADAAMTPQSEDDPAAWIERIVGQLDGGDRRGAAQQLAQFRARFPDVELPEKLRTLALEPPPLP